MLLLGAAGLLYRWTAYAVLGLSALISIRNIKKDLAGLPSYFKKIPGERFHVYESVLFFVLLVTVILTLAGTLAPPSLYDSLVYHLAAPSTYIREHRIANIPFNFFTAFPAVGEMLFTLGMLLYNDTLAQLIHFVFALLAAVAVYSFSRTYFDDRVGLVASLIFLSSPAVMFLSTGGYIDLILTCFVFLAFHSVVLWSGSGKDSHLVLAGIFSGLAAGTKYTGIIVFLIILSGITAGLIVRKHKICGKIALFVIAFLGPVAPWLIKNMIFTRNPVFPFLFNVFGGYNWDITNIQKYFTHIRQHGPLVGNPAGYLVLPWTLTMEGFKFGGSFDICGPAFLILIPGMFLVKGGKKQIHTILVFSILYYCVWLFTGKVARFLVPLLPCLSILAASVFVRIAEEGRAKAVFLMAVLSVTVLLNWWIFLFGESVVEPLAASAGIETRDEYLMRKVPYYPAVKFINTNAAKDSKVLFIGEARTYYCERNYIASSVFDKTPIVEWAEISATPGDLREIFRKNRITHVLLNAREAERLQAGYDIFYWKAKSMEIFEKFERKYLKKIFSQNSVTVYEVL